MYSMIVSVARQLIVLLPVAYMLARLGNVNYVWWAFPIAEFMSLAMTVLFLIILNKRLFLRLAELRFGITYKL